MRYFSSYIIFLAAIILFCTQTQAFCIYNRLDEGVFNIHEEAHAVSQRAFRKTFSHAGGKECCHYSNVDCNHTQLKTRSISFIVRFNFPHPHPAKVYRVRCAAGGALEFFGSLSNHYAICTPPDGQPSYKASMSPLI